jgi:predicted amidophosphoribosyltransferase
MWELIGRFRCSKCGEVRGLSRRALRSPFRGRVGVCRDCLSTWKRFGHRCGRCWSQVRTAEGVGLLLDKGVFAHVECGAAALV